MKEEYIKRRMVDFEKFGGFSKEQLESIKFRLEECWDICKHETAQFIRNEEYELRQHLLKD